jgi:hypothetical protein
MYSLFSCVGDTEIDLLAGNRIKLKAAANFKWFDNGSIQQFFQQKVATNYFNTQFTEQQEQLIVKNSMLSDAAMAVFDRKVEQLARDFDQLNNEDALLPLKQRHGGIRDAELAIRLI